MRNYYCCLSQLFNALYLSYLHHRLEKSTKSLKIVEANSLPAAFNIGFIFSSSFCIRWHIIPVIYDSALAFHLNFFLPLSGYLFM